MTRARDRRHPKPIRTPKPKFDHRGIQGVPDGFQMRDQFMLRHGLDPRTRLDRCPLSVAIEKRHTCKWHRRSCFKSGAWGWRDHCELFYRAGKPAMVVSHPYVTWHRYTFNRCEFNQDAAWLKLHFGLACIELGAERSFYFPNRTTAIVVVPVAHVDAFMVREFGR